MTKEILNSVLHLHWNQFNTLFPTERDCVHEVLQRMDPSRIRCSHCQSTEFHSEYGDRVLTCKNCRREFWLTANTLFHRARRIRPWLAAIWLMEQSVAFNANQLHELLNIAGSTASDIYKKVTTIILNKMDEQANVSSGEFAILLFRRSRETPAREHASAEQREVEQKLQRENQKDIRSERLTIISQLAGSEKKVFALLSDQPTAFDQLEANTDLDTGMLSSTLMMLEIVGLAERKSGDRYIRRVPDPDYTRETLDDETVGIIADFVHYVRVIFHGISRKYLQLYLAAYWGYIDSSRWQAGGLLRECLHSQPIRSRQILACVSPPVVKIPRQQYAQAA